MAEYIDKSKIHKAKPAEKDNYTGMGMTLDEMDAYNDGIDAMYELVMGAPKADVVERSEMDKEIALAHRLGQEEVRSKVNKAVKEIIKLSPTPTEEDIINGNREKTIIRSFLIDVLNIIEKNLGSD